MQRVVFVVPAGAVWSLPAYELALMTAARGSSPRGIDGVTRRSRHARGRAAAFVRPRGERGGARAARRARDRGPHARIPSGGATPASSYSSATGSSPPTGSSPYRACRARRSAASADVRRLHPGRRARAGDRDRRASTPPATSRPSRSSRAGSQRSRQTPPPRRSPPSSGATLDASSFQAGSARPARDGWRCRSYLRAELERRRRRDVAGERRRRSGGRRRRSSGTTSRRSWRAWPARSRLPSHAADDARRRSRSSSTPRRSGSDVTSSLESAIAHDARAARRASVTRCRPTRSSSRPEDTLGEVAEQMCEREVDCALVAEYGRLDRNPHVARYAAARRRTHALERGARPAVDDRGADRRPADRDRSRSRRSDGRARHPPLPVVDGRAADRRAPNARARPHPGSVVPRREARAIADGPRLPDDDASSQQEKSSYREVER